nr:hypothetical protein CFP56_52333 [Quercus suber]
MIFFLIKFELQSDLQVVLKGGPWYVGQHFLAIRKWELEFKAEEASLFFVAVWIRLPRLPIEFYDPIILKKTGRAIGPVLHIDTHTANGARGHFARLCTGHRKGNFPALIRSTNGANTNPSPSNSLKNSCSAKFLESDQTGNPLKEPDSSTPNKVTKLEATGYGEWMVVMQRKKPNGNGRTYSRGSNRDDAWGQDTPTNVGSFENDTSRLPMGNIAEGNIIPVGKSTITRIQRDPTKIMGRYNTEEMEAWKNIFPLIEVSARLGYLPLIDEAWFTIPNPYWHFLMDQPNFPPLIS